MFGFFIICHRYDEAAGRGSDSRIHQFSAGEVLDIAELPGAAGIASHTRTSEASLAQRKWVDSIFTWFHSGNLWKISKVARRSAYSSLRAQIFALLTPLFSRFVNGQGYWSTAAFQRA